MSKRTCFLGIFHFFLTLLVFPHSFLQDSLSLEGKDLKEMSHIRLSLSLSAHCLVSFHFSQINTQKIILTYDCPTIAWLICRQIFWNYHISTLPLGFYLSLSHFSFFPSASVTGSVAGWLVPGIPLSSLSCSPFFSLLLFIISAWHFWLSLPCLSIVVQLFIWPIRCFSQAK